MPEQSRIHFYSSDVCLALIRREGDLSRGIPDRENISRESSLLRFLIIERTIGYPERLQSNTQKAWRNFSYKISIQFT